MSQCNPLQSQGLNSTWKQVATMKEFTLFVMIWHKVGRKHKMSTGKGED